MNPCSLWLVVKERATAAMKSVGFHCLTYAYDMLMAAARIEATRMAETNSNCTTGGIVLQM